MELRLLFDEFHEVKCVFLFVSLAATSRASSEGDQWSAGDNPENPELPEPLTP